MDTAELFGCWLVDYLGIEAAEKYEDVIEKWEDRVRTYLASRGHLETFDRWGEIKKEKP